jgi:antitoxin component of MazEF toxin-antitoxin module
MSQYKDDYTYYFLKDLRKIKRDFKLQSRVEAKIDEILKDPAHYKPLRNVLKGKTRVHIGDSQAIPIPKGIIEECGFEREVKITINPQALIITRVRSLRGNWDKAFELMALNNDDKLLDSDAYSRLIGNKRSGNGKSAKQVLSPRDSC